MTPLQQFNVLPFKQRQSVLDKYRDYNTQHMDWWDCVYDTFQEDMKAIGVRVDKMYFTGFWSQGDGACFDGAVTDWTLFLTSIGYNDAALIAGAEICDWSFGCRHTGYRYYHENSVSYTGDINLPDSVDDSYFGDRWFDWGPDDIRQVTMMTNLSKYNSHDLHEEFATVFSNHAKDLYKQLYEEYSHLTSDAVVLESLDANDQLEDAIEEITEADHA